MASEYPTLKTLKKLAAACRKAGISKFRQGDLEFTLTEEIPVSNYRKSTVTNKTSPQFVNGDVIDKNFQSDELSPDALMFWSAGGAPEDVNEGEST